MAQEVCSDVPLTAGTRLGLFEILAPIGKGGMGEVYRAKDTKLGRDAAVKILPSELAADSERLGSPSARGSTARFAEPSERRLDLRHEGGGGTPFPRPGARKARSSTWANQRCDGSAC